MDAIRKIEATPMVYNCCGRVACSGKDCPNNGPWYTVPKWRMDAYYYSFEPTGLAPVDKVLSAVACAGKSYHNTESWNEENECRYEHLRGESETARIQNAAIDASSAIREVLQTLASKEAEIARLREAGKLAWLALCDAEGVLATVDTENDTEEARLEALINRVKDCAGILFCELHLPMSALTQPTE